MATYPGLRLLPEPLSIVLGAATRADAIAHYTAKRRVRRHDPKLTLSEGPQPLRALYVLESGPEIAIAPLAGREAFLALLRSCFPLHLDDQERSRGLFERIGRLRDAVPIRSLSYPRDFARLSAVREALIRDVAECDPVEALPTCVISS